MIKAIIILATEDGRNRSAFNPPPQGNETLAEWQHGSVGHRLFVEETIVALAFSFSSCDRGMRIIIKRG